MNPADDLKGNVEFYYDSPIHSDLETKLKQLILKLATDNKIIGIQVCAYKDGKVVIDTAAGVLGKDDPRPVQHDSLFPVFSVTKGITAGMVHWLVDNGKLKLDESVASIWPGFGINRKDLIKVHHVLNHTSGLHNAMSKAFENTWFTSNWEECLNSIVTSTPDSEPGQEQLYHYSSFGWLCGGIIEHASGKKFQEILNEAIVHPLNVEGELYIGIPPGVESRLASLTSGMEGHDTIPSAVTNQAGLPSTFQPSHIARTFPVFAEIFNNLQVRQAIVPSANGHCSARALARYYATLAAGGNIPPPYPPSKSSTSQKDDGGNRMFCNPKILDAFMGVGDYGDMALPKGPFGLGFRRNYSKEGLTGFGHGGMGGSNGFCDIKHQLGIAVVVNKMSIGAVTACIAELICSEFNVPLPQEFAVFGKGSE